MAKERKIDIDETPLYNIRIIKSYIDYIKNYHPGVSIESLLEYAGIENYEIDDDGYWFSQEQSDRFYEIAAKATGNPDVARESGRYATRSTAYGLIRQYITGFVAPVTAYSLIEKIANNLTRGGVLSTNKIRSNKVEIIARPAENVREKPYQCENRIGMLEALPEPFTGKFAHIEHPECIHNGDEHCRYVITWEESPSLTWGRMRNYFTLLSFLVLVFMAVLFPGNYLWPLITAAFAAMAALSIYSERLEKMELSSNIEAQSNTAELLLKEINTRYNDSLLVKEVGQAISMILEIDRLLDFVADILKRRLEFEKTVVLLVDKQKGVLEYTAGSGFSDEAVELLQSSPVSLSEVRQGAFRDVFDHNVPYLINDFSENGVCVFHDGFDLPRMMEVNSFICVPIIFKDETLGILAVGNRAKERQVSHSDMSLLLGIGQQIAISIKNARSYQKLQDSEEKYRELVENANSIILRIDPRGRITFFNEFAQQFFSFSENDVLGRHVVGTIVPDSDSGDNRFNLMMTNAVRNPSKYESIQSENVTSDGRRVWVAWTNRPIVDNRGEIAEILCVGIDVTAQKQAEMEKDKLENQLLRAQKMEAIGTLAGGVAHDLNNILSGIVSYPELLLMELPEESPLRKPIMTIKKSGERAAAIVQDLLTLARRGVATPDIISLSSVVREYLTSPEHENIKKNYPDVRFEVKLEDNLLNTMCSKVHLSKTIMNLVLNAVEAMPGGGVVRIATENRYVDRPISGYENVSEGEYAVFVIEDTGVGISEDDLSRIFEPFYTKKVMGRSGTGLGMAVVWGTVKDHDGYIEVNSEVGRGTRFDIYLPATRKERIEDETNVSLDELRGEEKILIVDDIEEQRDIAGQFLSLLGYSVALAASGEAAVEYCRDNQPDLILLDMIMDPGIDGLETYKRICKIHPGQKAIIVSGFSESDRVKEALALGAGSYVKKPYVIEHLGKAIRRELNKK